MSYILNASLIYSQRAASRLIKLLEEQGYPFDLMGRANALSQKLSIDRQNALAILSGTTPWTFLELMHICTVFEKDEGYFLNKNFSQDFPSDMRVVPSLDGGESIVWRVPEGFLKNNLKINPDVVLRYLTVPEDMKSELNFGNLLICASHPHMPFSLVVDDFYVLQTIESVEVMRCIDVQEDMARFEPLNHRIGALAIRFPNNYSGVEKRSYVRYKVIASIRAH